MIHVVGNAAIDTIFRVDRFPSPGETVMAAGMSEDIGGKGLNQAVVAARAGASVRLVAAVGDDAAAGQIRDALALESVAGDGLRVVPGSTDRSSIYVDAKGENTIVSLTHAATAFDPLASGGLDTVGRGDVVLCQGNLRLDMLVACLAAAREKNAQTVLNPSPVFLSAVFDWRLADVLVLNVIEARQLSGEDDPNLAAERLHAAGAATVIVTLGDDGAIMVSDHEALAIVAPKVDAVDTTGAGDAFCGVLTAMRTRGLSWPDSLAVAAEAAAVAVTRQGVLAAFPTVEEIARMVEKINGGDR